MARLDNTADLIDQVIAWHHRHPLALRIGLAQVAGLGWVSLPFAAQALAATASDKVGGAAQTPPASLRERAQARTQAGAEPESAPATVAADPFSGSIQAAFSEDLLSPLKPAAIAAFARACGLRAALAAHQRPRREAAVDRGLVPEGWGLTWLHVRTAAIEVGERRVRVLIAPDGSRILGPRLISRGRVALAVLLPVVVAGAGVATLWWPKPAASLPAAAVGPESAASASTPAPLAAASAASAASAPPPGSAQAVAASSAEAVASAASGAGSMLAAAWVPPASLAPPSPPSAASSATAPLPSPPASDVPPSTSSEPASIRPRLDPEVARAARRESAALRAGSEAAASPPPPAAEPARVPPPAAPTSPRAVAPPTAGPVYALVARTTKSRAASEILVGAMTPESGRAPGSPRAEVLAADGGFRASLWPFANRAQAERVRERLRASGLETELVEF